jgi:carbonic anhydrase
MNQFESMVQCNKAFAVQQSAAGTPMPSLARALPNVKALIIGCADMCGPGSCPWNQTG